MPCVVVGGVHFKKVGFELKAVVSMIIPSAACVDVFTRMDRYGRTDECNQIPVAARIQESGKSSDYMDEKDDEIAHLLIITKPGIT